MPTWPKQTPSQMNAFYGNPDANGDFKADPQWESANIVKIVPPYQLYYPQQSGNVVKKRAMKFSSLRVHKKCASSLLNILTQIGNSFTPAQIHDYELDLCAGVHVFKLKAGGTTLSTHAWGAAIDLSHLINGWKVKHDPDPAKKMMPPGVVAIFASEGWTWGGKWKTADGMHFQAADL